MADTVWTDNSNIDSTVYSDSSETGATPWTDKNVIDEASNIVLQVEGTPGSEVALLVEVGVALLVDSGGWNNEQEIGSTTWNETVINDTIWV